jgi:hypothetical protein
MAVPTYLVVYTLAADLCILAAVLIGLRQALLSTDWPPALRASTLRSCAALLIAWFAVALALSWLEFFRGAADRIPTIQFGVLLPILAGLALWRAPFIRRAIEAVPLSWIVGVQAYRTIGVIFLVLYASEQMPAAFALPAGIGDVFTGLVAPIVAIAYARRLPGAERLVLSWNLFGLLDLVVAVTMGFLTAPSPLQLLSLNAPNALISAFPLAMVPVFAVPLSVLLHFAALAKLRAATSRGGLSTGMFARSA